MLLQELHSLHIAVLSPDITRDGVRAALQPRPAAGLGDHHRHPRARVDGYVVFPDLPGLLHLDGLDAAALKPGLGSVPGQRDRRAVRRVVPPQVRHQAGLHVGLYLVPEHVGDHPAHHQDAEQEDGDGSVDHHQALHLLVGTVETEQAVGYA